jgi:hypothetical protein
MSEDKDKKVASSDDDWNDPNVGYRIITKEMPKKKEEKMNTSPAGKDPNIPSSMKNMEEKISVLSEETDRLVNRLGIALLPSSPSQKSSEERKSDSRSELASQLDGFAERIQSVIYRLRDTTERLDL